MADQKNVLLFAALTTAAEQCIESDDFGEQSIANTAWAFAKVARNNVLLFASLAKVAK